MMRLTWMTTRRWMLAVAVTGVVFSHPLLWFSLLVMLSLSALVAIANLPILILFLVIGSRNPGQDSVSRMPRCES